MADSPCPVRLQRARRVFLSALATLALVPWSACLEAQPFPSKTIRIIAPYSAGGNVDINARMLAKKLNESFGQPVVVDNRPGGSSIIGTELVARAAPDGYTLLLATDGSISANPYLYAKLSYDPQKDFTPVAMMVFANEILMVPPSMKVNTVREFVDLAKAHPGKFNYGSFGPGSPPHLAMALLARETGIELVHVPFKGNAPAQTAMLAGEIQAMFISIPGPLPFLRAGKLKALAIAAERRSPVIADVPTFPEAGFPGFRVEVWFGLLAPTGTPREIVQLLNTEINKIINTPAFREKYIASVGLDPAPMSIEQFADYLRVNREEIGRMVKISGAKLD